MAVFTLSSASILPKDPAGTAEPAAAACTAGTPRSVSQMSGRALRSAIFRFDRDPDASQEIGRQHAAGAHDHCIVAYVQHLTCMLDGDLLVVDLLHVGFQQYAQHSGVG